MLIQSVEEYEVSVSFVCKRYFTIKMKGFLREVNAHGFVKRSNNPGYPVDSINFIKRKKL